MTRGRMGLPAETVSRAAGSQEAPLSRLSGRVLLLARVAWLAVALLVLGVFVVGEFLYMAELRTTVCTEGAEACAWEGLLTPENVRELREMGLSAGFYAAFDAAINAVFVAVWLAVGALIFWRRSDDRMALLVALFLVTYGPMSFGPFAPVFLAEEYPALWWPISGLQFLGQACLALFFCLFPSGRFVPRWSRWLALVYLATQAPGHFFPGSPLDWIGRFELPGSVAIAPFWAGFLAAQVYRYRRVSGSVERRQTRWVIFGTTAAVGGFVGLLASAFIFSLPDASSIGFSLLAFWAANYGFLLLIPLSIGLAVLRSRLFDVDVLINRALVYGALTVTLALVYVASVVVLQRTFEFLTGGGSQLAVVASTLAIAALFNPVRRRVQDLIDRRFYRRKYDARGTLEAFSARLRDETDLDELSDNLVAVVRETVQPAHASLWLRERRGGPRR
jgi:hypothetical protein